MYYGVLLSDSPTAYSSDPRGGPQATERHTTVTAGTFKSFTTGTSGKRLLYRLLDGKSVLVTRKYRPNFLFFFFLSGRGMEMTHTMTVSLSQTSVFWVQITQSYSNRCHGDLSTLVKMQGTPSPKGFFW
jgi:hypothetical protein